MKWDSNWKFDIQIIIQVLSSAIQLHFLITVNDICVYKADDESLTDQILTAKKFVYNKMYWSVDWDNRLAHVLVYYKFRQIQTLL